MARLSKFNGTPTLPVISIPRVVADTAVGDAAIGFGKQIENASNSFADLARRRQKQINDFQLSKADRRVNEYVKRNLARELQVERPGAVGFTEAMLVHLEEGRKKVREDLPAESRAQFDQGLEAKHDEYVNRFARIEAAENENYFRRGLEEVLDQFVAEVRDNPELIDVSAEQAGDIVQALPLSATDKLSGLQKINESLAIAWVVSRPPEEQIDGLRALMAKSQANQHFDEQLEGASRKSRRQAFENSSSSVFMRRAIVVSPQKRHELIVEALKKDTFTKLREAEQFSNAVSATPFAFEPQEILNSPNLSGYQKQLLLSKLQYEINEHREDRKAIEWLGSTDQADENIDQQQTLAERAFAYLDDGETDRDVLAKSILRKKGVLPGSYHKFLKLGLISTDPIEVGGILDVLSELARDNPAAFEDERFDKPIHEALEKQGVLVEQLGMTPKQAVTLLAAANDKDQQRQLQADYDARLSGELSDFIAVGKVLDQLSG